MKTVQLTDDEWSRLERLAETRTKQSKYRTRFTPERCLKDMIAACQPEGGEWEHPSKAARP